MDEPRIYRLVELFKALADPARLRILGAIAEHPRTGKELSERLALTPPTISHHMARLVAAGLVRVTPDATRRLYSLEESVLRDAAREIARPAVVTTAPSGVAGDPEREKILGDFFVNGRLKQIPAQRKKRVIVLQYLLERFNPGRDYAEREVNEVLRSAHDDVATLRRGLVEYRFLTRADGIYRVATTLPVRGPTVAQEIRDDEQTWLHNLISGATSRALVLSQDT